MKRYIFLLVALLPLICLGAETDAPDPDTVPAVAERTYGDVCVSRISYFTGDGKPGLLMVRVRLADFISLAKGYALHPNEQKGHTFEVASVSTMIAQSNRFKLAIKEYHEVLILWANKDYLERKIAALLEADPGANVSVLQAKLAAVNTALQIQ